MPDKELGITGERAGIAGHTALNILEKLAKIVLWFSLASVCGILRIEYTKAHHAEAELKDAAKKAEDKLAAFVNEKDKKPERLTLASMGSHINAMDNNKAVGNLWFTNTSSRAGVVCVTGVAENSVTKTSTTSLPTCQEVAPYASLVHVVTMFAGGELESVCPKSDCSLKIQDVRE